VEFGESSAVASIFGAVGDSEIGEAELKRMSHHAETLPDVCVLQINVVIVFFGKFLRCAEIFTVTCLSNKWLQHSYIISN
jgi:hypothetical protein